MNRSEKTDTVAALNATFNEAAVVVVTRNLGLTVAQSTDLRLKMRDAGAGYKVAKNRLAKIALNDTQYESLSDLLTGPTTQVALEPVGPTPATGTVTMAEVEGTDGAEQLMSVDTSLLPPAPDDAFYEVWLLQPDTGQMLAVGVLPSDAASFTLPAALVANYQAVDVSLQPDDGGVVHSVDSVLRATYA